MPSWLSLLLAVILTVGFFGGIFALILAVFEARKLKASPRMGITSGGSEDVLKVWVNWDTSVFAFQVYRLRLRLTNPWGPVKEMTFSYTFEPPLKGPFAQSIKLPAEAVKILKNASENPRGILTVDFRTVEDRMNFKDYRYPYVRQLISGKGPKVPSGLKESELVLEQDPPNVMSLDYFELVNYRKRMSGLEAAAKAKAAKAVPPKPAATTPPAGGAPTPPAAKPAEPAKTPVTETAKAEPAKAEAAKSDAPKSIKEMIQQANSQEK